MAEKSTILKVALEVADVDRGYYGSHALTLARHPSETDERTMVRLLAFALFAGERLEFGRLIPAGTGLAPYHDFHLPEDLPEIGPDSDDDGLFDFGDDEIRTLPQEVLEGE